MDKSKEIVVAEISSFQLDTTSRFSPKVGLLLNITEDHLDRYPGFSGLCRPPRPAFFATRGKTMRRWSIGMTRSAVPLGKGSPDRFIFSAEPNKSIQGAYLDQEQAMVLLGGHQETYDLKRTLLCPGVHNLENALAAILGARLMGADPAAVQKTLVSF